MFTKATGSKGKPVPSERGTTGTPAKAPAGGGAQSTGQGSTSRTSPAITSTGAIPKVTAETF